MENNLLINKKWVINDHNAFGKIFIFYIQPFTYAVFPIPPITLNTL